MEQGIDLIQINRFTKLINNQTFLNKNFTANELNYLKRHFSLQTLAGLYASKEAFLKAVGKGLNYDLKTVEILHQNGKPSINLLKKDIVYQNISLTISHDGNYAIASVIILF